LPFYYNNNQRFLQERLDPKIIKDTKIFEKQQIKWICVDDIVKMKKKKEFRSFYQNIIDLILAQRAEIDAFIRKSLFKKSILKGKSYKKGGRGRTRRRETRRSTKIY
jgi:transcription termination factor NusB